EELQVEHQARVLLVRIGDDRRPRRQIEILAAVLFRALNPALDLADRVEVLVELAKIARPETLRERGGLASDGVEDAAGRACTRETLGARAAVAEQPLEHDTRMNLGEVRRPRVAP